MLITANECLLWGLKSYVSLNLFFFKEVFATLAIPPQTSFSSSLTVAFFCCFL